MELVVSRAFDQGIRPCVIRDGSLALGLYANYEVFVQSSHVLFLFFVKFAVALLNCTSLFYHDYHYLLKNTNHLMVDDSPFYVIRHIMSSHWSYR